MKKHKIEVQATIKFIADLEEWPSKYTLLFPKSLTKFFEEQKYKYASIQINKNRRLNHG